MTKYRSYLCLSLSVHRVLLCQKTLQLLQPSIRPDLRRLICKHNINTRMQVHLLTRDSPWIMAIPDPMRKIDDQEDRDPNVSGEERRRGKASREEHIEAIDKSEDDKGDYRDPGSHGLEEGGVGDILFGEGLHEIRFAEAEVYYAAADPGDETRGATIRSQYTIHRKEDEKFEITWLSMFEVTYLVRFTNQANTTDPLLAQLRYARGENNADAMTAMYGTPCFVHLVKIRGALPATAKE